MPGGEHWFYLFNTAHAVMAQYQLCIRRQSRQQCLNGLCYRVTFYRNKYR